MFQASIYRTAGNHGGALPSPTRLRHPSRWPFRRPPPLRTSTHQIQFSSSSNWAISCLPSIFHPFFTDPFWPLICLLPLDVVAEIGRPQGRRGQRQEQPHAHSQELRGHRRSPRRPGSRRGDQDHPEPHRNALPLPDPFLYLLRSNWWHFPGLHYDLSSPVFLWLYNVEGIRVQLCLSIIQ